MPKKISQLPAAASVQSSDLIPVVQGGATRQASVGQLLLGAPRKFQVVATRGSLPNAIWGNGAGGRSDTRAESRRKCLIGNQPVSQIKLAFAGYYIVGGSGEIVLANDCQIEAAVELASPAGYARTYLAGSAIATLPAGIPLHITEPAIGYDLAAGATLYARVSVSVSSSSTAFQVSNAPVSGSGETGYVSAAASSQVAATGVMTNPSGGAAFNGLPPYMVLGIPAAPMAALCYLGDSIADGVGDVSDTFGSIGFIARGLNSVNGYPMPWVRQTVGSDTFSKNTLDTAGRKRSAWPYVTHLVCQLGTNDISNGTTLTAMQSYATSVWQAAKRTIGPYGKPLQVAQVLVMPRTTSTDSWATPGNQTPMTGFSAGGVRDQFNAWCVAQVGQGLLDAIINVNQYVEDQSNAGKWVTNGSANYPTTDGIHPSSAAHILASQAVNAWAAGITP